jgi:hypothetical protein
VPGYVALFLIFVKAIPTCRRGDVPFLFMIFHVKILAGRVYEHGFTELVISLRGVHCVSRPSTPIFGKVELKSTGSTAV